jgi:hypothetical protein
MAKLYQDGRLLATLANRDIYLAHIQHAAYERFQKGKGFFITFLGAADDAGNVLDPFSVWCSPSTALVFEYTNTGKTIAIDPKLVDALRHAMTLPTGVTITPRDHDHDHYPLPFEPSVQKPD